MFHARIEKLPRELQLLTWRNVATQAHLTICDAVADGWNKAWQDDEQRSSENASVTGEVVYKAYKKARGRRRTARKPLADKDYFGSGTSGQKWGI